MNESEGEATPVKTWQKAKHANLVRNVSSGNYYARFRVKGKLVWRCLDTDRISVAQIRLADELKKERQKAGSGMAVARGRLTAGDAVRVYRERLQGSPQLKAKTKFYHEQRLAAILKSWPGLEKFDLAKVTKTDCLNWAAKFGKERAPSTFNHSLGILRQVFEIAVETGGHDMSNPATKAIKRRGGTLPKNSVCRSQNNSINLLRRLRPAAADSPNLARNWCAFLPTAAFASRRQNTSLGPTAILRKAR